MNTAKTDIDAAHAPAIPVRSGGILVVDDHELVRLGFRAFVKSQTSSTAQSAISVYEAHTLNDALSLYGERHADIAVVVLDLNLPDADGLDGLMAFRRQFPSATVVVLSGTDNPTTVQSALTLGAASFFSKSGDLGNLVSFVHLCVLHGPEAACKQQSTEAFSNLTRTSDPDRFALAPGQTLSVRQLQILQWLLQGKSNREISQLAFLSEGTVKNHVSTLLLSFSVKSRAQLISTLRA